MTWREAGTCGVAPPWGTPAEQLWREGSIDGAPAHGFANAGATVRINREHPTLAWVEDELQLDAVFFRGLRLSSHRS